MRLILRYIWYEMGGGGEVADHEGVCLGLNGVGGSWGCGRGGRVVEGKGRSMELGRIELR